MQEAFEYTNLKIKARDKILKSILCLKALMGLPRGDNTGCGLDPWTMVTLKEIDREKSSGEWGGSKGLESLQAVANAKEDMVTCAS